MTELLTAIGTLAIILIGIAILLQIASVEDAIGFIGRAVAALVLTTWNALKTFWALYFREAGAELVSYSAECSVERE